MNKKFMPELLAPAGCHDALISAILAGADAVYLGLQGFNARVGAENFTKETFERDIKLCRLYGKKAYLTLNTLVFDREIDSVLDTVEFCMGCGVDAFIVQDFGLMRLLSKVFPDIVLHSSTQCATHNLDAVKRLAEMGVKRAVVARELSKKDLEIIMANTPIEIEAFVHGALCMSHSGTCLMSAYFGGRSGNRGECAQPCRLPWKAEKGSLDHALSLKDLSLSNHVKELCDMGVHSLKIEGRMKSAVYVNNTVRVFRTLIDEYRNADEEETKTLENTFSRQGFTDGYFTLKKGRSMFGVRGESDKEKTRESENKTLPELQKIPVRVDFSCDGEGAFVKMRKGEVEVSCPVQVEKAKDKGTGEEVIVDALSKLGNTNFVCEEAVVKLSEPIFAPRSVLNEARRCAVEKLEKALVPDISVTRLEKDTLVGKDGEFQGYWVVFDREAREGEVEALLGREEVLRVFVPLFSVKEDKKDRRVGVVLPRAVFEKDKDVFTKALDRAKTFGYTDALVNNLGVGEIAKSHGFEVYADAGLNAVNSETLAFLKENGFRACIVSPEMNFSARRDIKKVIETGEMVFSRAPLMLVENCIMGVRDNCFENCKGDVLCKKRTFITDRTGEKFPVVPDAFHRSVIYNSRPSVLYDTPVPHGLSFRVIRFFEGDGAVETLDRVLSGKVFEKKFVRK